LDQKIVLYNKYLKNLFEYDLISKNLFKASWIIDYNKNKNKVIVVDNEILSWMDKVEVEYSFTEDKKSRIRKIFEYIFFKF
jgi:hypothetical protein